MLPTTWLSVLLVAGQHVIAMTPSHAARVSVSTPEATIHELQKRRGGGSHVVGGGSGGSGSGSGSSGPDYTATTTCGIIPNTLATQYNLYGINTMVPIPTTAISVYCEGLCAHQGNYLGCIGYKTASVASACHNYGATACPKGQACHWDTICPASAPICNSYIYEGTITQFTCAPTPFPAITMLNANMVSYVPSNTSSSSAPTSVSDALSRIGLSLGEVIGIGVAAIIVFGACCGWCCWRRRRNRKERYAGIKYQKSAPSPQPPQYREPYMEERNYYQQDYRNPYHNRYHHHNDYYNHR